MEDDFPIILTLQDAANLLLTTPDILQAELEAHRLHGFRVGSEWRTTKQALLDFIGPKPSAMQDARTNTHLAKTQGEIDMSSLNWQPIDEPFTYTWPKNASDPEPNTEKFERAYHAELKFANRTFPMIIAFTYRPAAGMNRRRAVVFFKHNPAVEFVGADAFDQSRLLASIIKGKDGKHLRVPEELPVEYATMPVDLYTNLVTGPYAARSMAVVADEDDLTLMARHALIRAQWKNWLD